MRHHLIGFPIQKCKQEETEVTIKKTTFCHSNTQDANYTSDKKVFRMKTSALGMEPSKTSPTRWEGHHNTFTPSLRLGYRSVLLQEGQLVIAVQQTFHLKRSSLFYLSALMVSTQYSAY